MFKDSFIVPINVSDFSTSVLNKSILIDWNLIQNRTDLLKQFYLKFNLISYIWYDSLDTFYDIIRDADFIKTTEVAIVISNYNKLLKNDKETHDLFFSILISLMVNYSNIKYKVYILK